MSPFPLQPSLLLGHEVGPPHVPPPLRMPALASHLGQGEMAPGEIDLKIILGVSAPLIVSQEFSLSEYFSIVLERAS